MLLRNVIFERREGSFVSIIITICVVSMSDSMRGSISERDIVA